MDHLKKKKKNGICFTWPTGAKVWGLERSQELVLFLYGGVLTDLPVKRSVAMKIGASVFSYRSMKHLCSGSKVKNSSVWVLMRVSGHHGTFSISRTHCLQNRNNRELPNAFLLKRKSGLICQTDFPFLILCLIEETRNTNHPCFCLSFEISIRCGSLPLQVFLTTGS